MFGYCHDFLNSKKSFMENSNDREVLFSRENEEKKEFLSIQKAPKLFIKICNTWVNRLCTNCESKVNVSRKAHVLERKFSVE